MRIRLTVEVGRKLYEDIQEIPDEEWNAMTEKERNQRCSEMAVDFQNEKAPCGWKALEEEESANG
jgi:hypothetical protein